MAGGMKRLAKETAVYGLSSIIGRFLNWMLVPMYTRVFTDTGDFGIVTNLYGWVALLLVLLTFGMETGFFRFINKKEETEPMRVYATTMAWVGGLSGTFLLLSLLFLQPIADALRYTAPLEYLGMMLGITAVDAFCCIPFAYLRYAGQAYRFAGIKLLGIFLNIFLNIFFLVICPWLYTRMPEAIGWFYRPDYGVGYVFVANVITTGITFLCLLPSMLPGFKARPNGTLLKEMLHYSFPILILGIAGIFNQTADKILFPLLFDDKTEAYRQLCLRTLYLCQEQKRRKYEGVCRSHEILHHLLLVYFLGSHVLHRHHQILCRQPVLRRSASGADCYAGRILLWHLL